MTANFDSFGEFELDRSRFELGHKGRAVKPECIAMEALILLIEKDGSVVSPEARVDRL
jgi:DNA-binding winged helix-turn-helix (wHTH) protein